MEPKRTSFTEILLAIQAQIAKATHLPVTAIKLIGRNNASVPKLTAMMDVLVRPSGFVEPVGGEQGAGGRVDLKVVRTVLVFSRVSMSRDETDRDTQWLTGGDGIFKLEESIINGLIEFFPMHKTGEQMTTQGLKMTRGTDPDRELTKGSTWGDSCVAFNVEYMPPMDLSNYGMNPG